ncbi:hypothetical protein TPY_3209 [Sulfobacillus acidophilus TPY]|uniref:Uncharacterized protein n=1 Tax=Sulfobacillus acidophilus (strain ATCC 700253 / DSM 10332 / NAL) TaxID=679936 RepID=G8TZG0_SULAD|nr:hypothetical protein TPY_3209 [Sulfobacillus acidophilus TPY]AEW05200.1 hypothetical protein Sulac_1704 [Sulfobacillus acidophilus DSM 10332]
MPLVQCPQCGRAHKSQAKKRWHCTACGTLWDASGRVVTGRPLKPGDTSKALAARGLKPKAERESVPQPEPPKQEQPKKKRFWDVEVL